MEEEINTIQMSKPLMDLMKLRGKKISIDLINGKNYTGILESFDVYMNIVLKDCKITDNQGTKDYGIVFLRASYGVLNI
ncbi:MAG TPA: LSM domain-containing protein [Candidatus Nanoarchaeia archaeon]|nr:LSM domain-containing protein [Candidatus Nanoarchaeia archaeon]